MTEIFMPVVICDKCAPGELPAIDRGTHMFDMKPSSYSVGFSVEQARDMGWEECDYGDLCPDCAKAEKGIAEQDEATGVEHGPVGNVPPFIPPDEYEKLKNEPEIDLHEVQEELN